MIVYSEPFDHVRVIESSLSVTAVKLEGDVDVDAVVTLMVAFVSLSQPQSDQL